MAPPGRRSVFRLIVFALAVWTALAVPPWAAVAQKPAEPQRTQLLSFDALYESGIRSLREGQAEQAMELLTRAAKLKPDDKMARCSLAQAFADAGQLSEAIEQFQRCAQLDAGDIQAHYNLGQAYLHLALATAAEVLKSDATSPYARRIFAENYIARGDFGEAETQYRLALEAEPDALDLYLALADLYPTMGKPGRAREELQRTVVHFPFSVAAHYEVGEASFVQGDVLSALAQLRWVAEFNPRFLRSRTDFPRSSAAKPSSNSGCASLEGFADVHPQEPALTFMKEACGRTLSRGKPPASRAEVGSENPSQPPGLLRVEDSKLPAGQLCWQGFVMPATRDVGTP